MAVPPCQGVNGKICCNAFGIGHRQSCLAAEQAKHIFSGLAGRSPAHVANFMADFGLYTTDEVLRARNIIGFDMSDEVVHAAFPCPLDHDITRIAPSSDACAMFDLATHSILSLEEILSELLSCRGLDDEIDRASRILKKIENALGGSLDPLLTKEEHSEICLLFRRALDVDSLRDFVKILPSLSRKRKHTPCR